MPHQKQPKRKYRWAWENFGRVRARLSEKGAESYTAYLPNCLLSGQNKHRSVSRNVLYRLVFDLKNRWHFMYQTHNFLLVCNSNLIFKNPNHYLFHNHILHYLKYNSSSTFIISGSILNVHCIKIFTMILYVNTS